MPPKLYLGVDGGQSGMRALLSDEAGSVVGAGRSEGPTSPTDGREGRERFAAALQSSIAAACREAGVDPATTFTAACLGFSGGPEDKEVLVRRLVPAEACFITHDAWVALTGATDNKPGIVTIAGTGSIAFGRNPAGQTARAGGWGFALGDEGGAFDVARQALRAALRQEEGWGPPTALREALVEAGSGERRVRDVNDLMHRFYTGEFSRAQVAGWSRIVEDLALRGDAVAQELLNAAAQSLAVIAGAVRRNLFGEEGATSAAGSVDVRYCGGMFRCRAIAARFQMLLEMDHRTRVSPPVYESAAGALLEAFRIAGAQLTLKNVPHPEP